MVGVAAGAAAVEAARVDRAKGRVQAQALDEVGVGNVWTTERDQKTEQPTAKKLADSAREGDVLMSKELATALMMLAGAGWLGITSKVGVMEKAMSDDDLRDVALHSYALAAPGDTSPARMRSLFRKIEKLAGGLSSDEAEIVGVALDARLQMHGYPPQFAADEQEWGEEDETDPDGDDGEAAPAAAPAKKEAGRNDPCPCGSGKKYKKCCGR
mgnify:CR=1 FL=1